MPSNPSVSVVIPTFARAQLLGRSVESVLRQTHSDWELLVVDDASPEAVELPETVVGDARCRLLRRDANGGPAAARNTGIEAAAAQLVTFLDDDDAYEPRMLERMVNAFSNTPEAGFGWCGVRWISDRDESSVAPREEIWQPTFADREAAYRGFLRGRRIGTNCGLMVRREVFERIGGFEASLRCGEDTEFLIRAARAYDFVVVPEVLIELHAHSGVRARHAVAENARAYELIVERHSETLASDHELRAALLYKLGWLCHHAGRRRDGRRHLWRSFRSGGSRAKTLLMLGLLALPGGKAVHRGLSKARGGGDV